MGYERTEGEEEDNPTHSGRCHVGQNDGNGEQDFDVCIPCIKSHSEWESGAVNEASGARYERHPRLT